MPEDTETKVFTRLSVNINDDTAAVLQRHKAKGVSITETIRRAIALLDLVEREHDNGSKLQLVDKQGHVRELLLLR